MEPNAFISLIVKQLRGELDPTGLAELNGWLAANSANRQLADDFRRTWQATERQPEVAAFSINFEKEFALLEARIQADEKLAGGRIVRLGWASRLTRVAAAAAVLLTAGGLGWWYFSVQPVIVVEQLAEHRREIQLSDGSIVRVNRGAVLTHPQIFSGKKRSVELTGEAFFEVSPDASKPFLVETELATVRVVGTRFNVRAIENEPTVEIFVEEGKVIVEANGQQIALMAGQTGIFEKKTGQLAAEKAPTENAVAWVRGKLAFKNATLKNVAADLSRFYGVKIEVNPLLENCRFENSFSENTEVESALKIVAAAFQANVEQVSERQFRMTGGQICQ